MFVRIEAPPHRMLKAEHALLGAVCGGAKSGWRQYPLQLQEGQSKCNTQGTICSQHKFISHKGCKLQCFLSEQEALVFLFVSVCVGWIPSTSLAISRPQYNLGRLKLRITHFQRSRTLRAMFVVGRSTLGLVLYVDRLSHSLPIHSSRTH